MNPTQRFKIFRFTCWAVFLWLTVESNSIFFFLAPDIFFYDRSLFMFFWRFINLLIIDFYTIWFQRKSGRLFNMFHQDQINNTKTVDKFFYFIIDKIYSKLPKNWFSFTEDTVSMGNGFFNLVNRMLFLNIMQCVLKIRKLKLNIVCEFICLVRQLLIIFLN